MNNFLTPMAIVKFGKFISFEKDENNVASNIVTSDTAEKGNFILASDVEGNKFVLRLQSNDRKEIDADFINWFFKEKSERSVKDALILKIKEQLSDDDKELEYIEKYCDDNNLGRKEGREFEKEYFDKKSKEIALNDKLIKPDSIVRIPLSSSKGEIAIIDDVEFPIYNSLCLIVAEENGEKKPSFSGIYYLSQSRHELPIIFIKSKKDNTKYSAVINTNILTMIQFDSLVKHSVRTCDETEGFFLYFVLRNNMDSGKDKDIKLIFEDLNAQNRTVDSYKEHLEKLVLFMNDNPDYLKNISIFLPNKYPKSDILEHSDSLINKIPGAITNISLSTQYSNNEDKKLLEDNIRMNIKEDIMNNDATLYGIYSILSLSDAFESDTYGFIKNNYKASSFCYSLKDTLQLIDKFKEKRLIDLEPNIEYESKFLKEDVKDGKFIF